jgi:nucleotide-binding universal stress UspA family protein
MRRVKTIIVGIDGSDTAMKAAAVAVDLAAATGATLHVVSAVPSRRSTRLDAGKNTVLFTSLDDAEAALADAKSRFRTKVKKLTTTAVSGKPAKVLIDEAKRLDADVIVVGNRRMRGAKRILGAVAAEVAHNAPCAVYIAKTT